MEKCRLGVYICIIEVYPVYPVLPTLGQILKVLCDDRSGLGSFDIDLGCLGHRMRCEQPGLGLRNCALHFL
jgi:hypothetical protein